MNKILILIIFCTYYEISASTEQHTFVAHETPAEATSLLSAIQLTNASELELKREKLELRRQDLKNNAVYYNEMMRLKKIEIRSNPCYRILRCCSCLCSPLNYCFGQSCNTCR